MRIWVVLPAYNEAQSLPAIYRGLQRLQDDTYNLHVGVIVVDDGSTDTTARTARDACGNLSVEVVENDGNQGLAATFMRGMMLAAERASDEDVIICMDADNTHLPGQIPNMLRSIQEGRDVVIASRYQSGAVVRGVPAHRRLLSRVMSLLFRAVYPIQGVRDYSCGYRAYRASLIKSALAAHGTRLFATEGFACMVGILLRLHKEDAICAEVPLVLRYDQKEGASKMQVGSTILKTLQVLLRERFSSPTRSRTASVRTLTPVKSPSVASDDAAVASGADGAHPHPMNPSSAPVAATGPRRPHQRDADRKPRVWLWSLLVVLVTGGLHVQGMTSWPWDTDEVYSLEELKVLDPSVHRPPASPDSFSVRLPKLVPVWYTAQRGLLRILPVSEWSTRLLSTACGVVAALVLFAFGWRRRGWQFALALVVLVNGSQLMIWLSQQNRFYGTAMLFLVLALLAIWSETTGLKGILATMACTLLAMFSHNLLVVVFGLGMAAACVAWPLGWISKSVLLRSVIAGLLAVLVYFLHVSPLAGDWTGAGLSGTGPLPSFVAHVGVPTLALAGFGSALALVVRSQRPQMAWWAGLAGGSLVFVVAAPWVMPVWNARYAVLFIVPFWIMAAFAMEYLARQLHSTKLTLLWYGCVALLLLPKLASHYMDGSRHDYRQAARVVAEAAHDGVQVYSNADWEVRYYSPVKLRPRVHSWTGAEPLPPSECLIVVGSNAWDAIPRFPGRCHELLGEFSRRRYDELSHVVRVFRIEPAAGAVRKIEL